MLFRTLPVVGLLLAGLVALASAHFDYQEFDSRDSLYDARDYVDVPFQPSLRAFLEGAVDAHEHVARSLALDVDTRAPSDLESRLFGKKVPKVMFIGVKQNIRPPNVMISVEENDKFSEIKKKIIHAVGPPCEPKHVAEIWVGTKEGVPEKKMGEDVTLWSLIGKGDGIQTDPPSYLQVRKGRKAPPPPLPLKNLN
ncbi:hypothetical protein D9611_012870 [Ephemerocybe angulata]|uniref:Uncharacterized protein n=1 Tax=Ephemerocybe angulata TaxID=980116 RepID=A0A8H5BAV4_9AGAR|nr:hypothetical protein D9611_012870 [Tulosesus angulatus]